MGGEGKRSRTDSRTKSRMKRAKKRPSRRRRNRSGLLLTAVLVVILLAAGIYYVGRYQRHMEYVRYPLRYREILTETARAHELEPWHVAAVVMCESSFRETAVSRVDARGLMQIMPDTGEWLAGKFDEEDEYTPDVLFDPETNLKYGCWYLSWLMDRYDGDRTVATAAFHAGQGKVDQWLEDPEISPDGRTLTVEKIPYRETRTYVGRILKACGKYRELYEFDEAADAV